MADQDNTASGPDGRIPPPRRRRRGVLLVAGVALVTGGLLLAAAGSSLRPVPTVSVRPVLFAPASAEADAGQASRPGTPAKRTVQAPGWLEADPYSVAATALTDGVVAEVLMLEGESVQEGQVVARLVRRDAELALARAEADLLAAEAAVTAAEAALHAAETDWNEPVERTRAVATAKAGLDRVRALIAQLPALIAAERALAEQLAEELERTELAHRSGAANEIEALVARKRLEASQATVQSLELQAAVLHAERDLAAAELAAAERLARLRTPERLALDDARAALAAARAAHAGAVAARDEAALRLERTEIRAPIGGAVQRRYKSPGDKVMLAMDNPESAQLLRIFDPGKLQVRVDVPLADAAEIEPGQPCEVVVEILPDRRFRGEVTRITHQADLQKNTLQIKVRLLDPSPLLKPDMLTRVKFLGSAPAREGEAARADEPAVLVPDRALVSTAQGTAVHAVRERRAGRGRLTLVPVTVLGTADGWASVRADLRPGDLLALDPPADAGRVRLALAEEPS